jgi:biopolymer transport protein ExbD
MPASFFETHRLYELPPVPRGQAGHDRQEAPIHVHPLEEHQLYFSKETADHFDLDAQINIWIKSRKEPIALEFRKEARIRNIFNILSHS